MCDQDIIFNRALRHDRFDGAVLVILVDKALVAIDEADADFFGHDPDDVGAVRFLVCGGGKTGGSQGRTLRSGSEAT